MTIYTASKIKHAPMWRGYRSKGFDIISTWIDEAESGQSCDLVDLWIRCVREASQAECLIVFASHGEVPEILKGAFVEVGAALASGKQVYAVGLRDSDGSWVNHPLVKKCNSITEAMQLTQGK